MSEFGGGKCPNFGGGKCLPGKWPTPIITYALEEHDPGSPQNGKTSSELWSPAVLKQIPIFLEGLCVHSDKQIISRKEIYIIADSAQTEYCSSIHFPSVCPSQAWHFNFSQLFDDIKTSAMTKKMTMTMTMTMTKIWKIVEEQIICHFENFR